MMPAGGSKVFCGGLGPSNFAHGVVEGEAEHLDKEVDGVAGAVSLGPTPIGVFDDEAGKGGQLEVAGLALDELEPSLLQQRN